MRSDRREIKRLIGAVMLLVMAILVIGYYFVGTHLEKQTYRDKREEMSKDFGHLPTMTYQGNTYRAKPNLSSILLIGYDLEDGEEKGPGYRGGGQSDFMLLLAIDHHNKQIHQLLLDRDTMTDVAVLGLTGRPAGTRNMQLCLSHAYGKDVAENDAHTRESVENLLQGISIDGTVSMRMGSVDVLNHVLGGITITLEDDFSKHDPQMVVGATLKLTDEQAKIFVRGRMDIGDGKNTSRMRRHSAYMSAAAEQMMQQIRSDSGFAKVMLETMHQVIHSSLTDGRLINEMNRAVGYQVLPLTMLEGEHTRSDRGYVEFYPSEESIMAWVTTAFYSPVE